ncbi:hypothetical protein [Mycobacterium uberis]|uniref:hypothetical protein n=1 Tax=Mycobacterium uberis TaxID=2162698 RepID=UPI001403F4F0|nr:hypothetical protein [Mycobacterium uberis]
MLVQHGLQGRGQFRQSQQVNAVRGNNTSHFTQLRINQVEILVGTDVHHGLRKCAVLALPSNFPIGKHIVEHGLMAVADGLSRKLSAADQAHHGRTTHATKVSVLPGGHCHALRRTSHRIAGLQGCHHLSQLLMNFSQELDAVMLITRICALPRSHAAAHGQQTRNPVPALGPGAAQAETFSTQWPKHPCHT